MIGSTDYHYCGLDELKSELELGSGAAFTDSLDALLLRAIGECSRMVDSYKRVEPGAYKNADTDADQTRYFDGSGGTVQFVDYCTSVTSIAVDETLSGSFVAWVENTDFYLLPFNAEQIGEPYRRIETTRKTGTTKSVFARGRRSVRVVGTFGISAQPPADVSRAVLITVQRWFQRALQGWADTGANVDLGNLRLTQSFDPEAKQLLDSAFPRGRRVSI